jgi:2'-5' RNA ligase
VARHFFALWPAEDAAQRLTILARAVADKTGGRPVPPRNIHLTLSFLGELDGQRISEARDVAAAVQACAFSLRLDTLGAFRRARVAWITDSTPAAELLGLHAALDAALRARGFALEDRAFNPHVTLARRTEATQPLEPTDPVGWRATDFALVRSDPAGYVTVASWGLGP